LNTEFIAIQKRCVIVNTLGNIFLVIFLSDWFHLVLMPFWLVPY
jgi:hypothetical protein